MQNANDKSYSFTEAAVNNAVELVRYLMVEYNIPADRVIRHYDVNGKPCPGIYGWNTESGSEAEWKKFKARIEGNAAANYKTLYRIQVGAYSVKANAEVKLKEVQKYFPEAFIVETKR